MLSLSKFSYTFELCDNYLIYWCYRLWLRMMLAEHFLLSSKRARQNIIGEQPWGLLLEEFSLHTFASHKKFALQERNLYAFYSTFLLYKVYLFIALGLMCREEVSM